MTDTEPSDEELMARFAGGDGPAFAVLVQRHRSPVFGFVLRLTGERARAEDVLQDTWLKVVRGASGWTQKARFTTWLYTIARNLCVDGGRRDQHRRAEPLEAAGEASDASVLDPERAAASAELRPALEEAIRALPEEQREVFLLRELSGVPFAEIARITATPENTVKSRMRYALLALRARLEAAGVGQASERTAG